VPEKVCINVIQGGASGEGPAAEEGFGGPFAEVETESATPWPL